MRFSQSSNRLEESVLWSLETYHLDWNKKWKKERVTKLIDEWQWYKLVTEIQYLIIFVHETWIPPFENYGILCLKITHESFTLLLSTFIFKMDKTRRIAIFVHTCCISGKPMTTLIQAYLFSSSRMMGLSEFRLMKWERSGTMKLWMPEQACSTARIISWPCQRSSLAFLYVQCSQLWGMTQKDTFHQRKTPEGLIARFRKYNSSISKYKTLGIQNKAVNLDHHYIQYLKRERERERESWMLHLTSPHFRQQVGLGVPIRWHRVLLFPEYRVTGGGPVTILQSQAGNGRKTIHREVHLLQRYISVIKYQIIYIE